MRVRTPLAATVVFAACSSSTPSTDPSPMIDAPASSSDARGTSIDAAMVDAAIDAPVAVVLEVTCPATVPLTVDAPDNQLRYVLSPASGQLAVGGIAKFTMHSDHNVIPSRTSAMTDTGLNVNFNQTKCLMFTRVGTFKFECGPHGFEGTIVVQ